MLDFGDQKNVQLCQSCNRIMNTGMPLLGRNFYECFYSGSSFLWTLSGSAAQKEQVEPVLGARHRAVISAKIFAPHFGGNNSCNKKNCATEQYLSQKFSPITVGWVKLIGNTPVLLVLLLVVVLVLLLLLLLLLLLILVLLLPTTPPRPRPPTPNYSSSSSSSYYYYYYSSLTSSSSLSSDSDLDSDSDSDSYSYSYPYSYYYSS